MNWYINEQKEVQNGKNPDSLGGFVEDPGSKSLLI